MAQPLTDNRAARPPLQGVRETSFAFSREDLAGQPADGLTLDGYGAVFNSPTVIDSWEGRFREQISPGSMKKSFRESPPRVQFDHGRHPLIGSIPIASLVSISEDVDPTLAPEGGAHVVARIFDNWLMQPVRDAIAAGEIRGMSFRFDVVRETWQKYDGTPIKNEDELYAALSECMYMELPDDQLPLRTLKELRVAEIGPVVWPAYSDTSVSVRSQVIDLGRLDDPEQLKLLARAVFMVDTAQEKRQGDAPLDTEASAVKHPSPVADAPRSTDIPSAGEHPSPRGLRDIDLVLRNQRDSLITLKRKEYSR
jgi:phage head maturation protease